MPEIQRFKVDAFILLSKQEHSKIFGFCDHILLQILDLISIIQIKITVTKYCHMQLAIEKLESVKGGTVRKYSMWAQTITNISFL